MDLDPAGHDISLLGDDIYLTGGNVYLPGYESLGASTATGHNSASNVKQAISVLDQYFNVTLKKEKESNASALAESETLKVRMA